MTVDYDYFADDKDYLDLDCFSSQIRREKSNANRMAEEASRNAINDIGAVVGVCRRGKAIKLHDAETGVTTIPEAPAQERREDKSFWVGFLSASVLAIMLAVLTAVLMWSVV